jgi:hypothetical protein
MDVNGWSDRCGYIGHLRHLATVVSEEQITITCLVQSHSVSLLLYALPSAEL